MYGLSRDKAASLFAVPFRKRNLSIQEPEAVLEHVVTESGCMPAIIQAYGEAVWHTVSREDHHAVTLDDVLAAERTPMFRERVVHPLLIEGDALKRLVVCLICSTERTGLSREEIDRAISALGLRLPAGDLERALQRLEVTGVLRPLQGVYTFLYPVLPRLLRGDFDLESYIPSLLSDLQSGS